MLKKIARVLVPMGSVALAATPLAPLAPILPFIVRGLEATFGAKTGETKKALAINLAMNVVDQLQTAGLMPAAMDKHELDVAIEYEVGRMKDEGYTPIFNSSSKDLAIDIAVVAMQLAQQIRDDEV